MSIRFKTRLRKLFHRQKIRREKRTPTPLRAKFTQIKGELIIKIDVKEKK